MRRDSRWKKYKYGEYVRTRQGLILKILNFDQMLDMYLVTDNEYKAFVSKNDIKKHSKNIIDLIEKDDWVNRQHVQIVKSKNKYLMVGNGLDGFQVWEEDIRSIVTKEQFASIEYKIKER